MTDIFRLGQELQAPYSPAWATLAKRTTLAVMVTSRTGVTVWLSRLRLARAADCGSPVPAGLPRERPAVSGAVVQACEHGVGTVEL